MELSEAQRASLDALTRQDGYDGSVSARAQIVLWRADGFSVADIVRMSGASKPTVYKWVDRYERFGVDGLTDLARSGRPPEVPDSVRSRIVALTRCTPPAETGLSHWSSRAMATYLKRTDGIAVSHNFIAQVWRDHDLQPHRQGTFKLSTDPDFEAKVADVVGLYLDPRWVRWCCRSTRRPRCRPWTGRSRCCRSTSRRPRSAPTTTCGTAPRTCSPRWTPSPDTCSDSATSGGAPRSFSGSWTQLSHGTASTRSMSSWTTWRPTRGMTWTPGSPRTQTSPFTSRRPAVPG